MYKYSKEEIGFHKLFDAFKEKEIPFSHRKKRIYINCEKAFDYEFQTDDFAICEKRAGFINSRGGEYVYVKNCSLEECVKYAEDYLNSLGVN